MSPYMRDLWLFTLDNVNTFIIITIGNMVRCYTEGELLMCRKAQAVMANAHGYGHYGWVRAVIEMTVIIDIFVIVTFSSSRGGSPFYESLMVGVRFNSLLCTPLLPNTSGIVMSLHAYASLPFSHDSLSAGPPGLPLHGLDIHFYYIPLLIILSTWICL